MRRRCANVYVVGIIAFRESLRELTTSQLHCLSFITMSSEANETNVSNEMKTIHRFPRDWLQKLVHPSAEHPVYALAPMVDQSDLPFRLLCRKYGSNLCFTPMIHAKLFATQTKYRHKFNVKELPSDRPLIAQLCGSDANHVLETAQIIQDRVDGIDINCGCPQNIARRGHYGAFLLEDRERLISLVRQLVDTCSVPISVKVRLLPNAEQQPDVEASLSLYKALVDAGASMLTIHARTRFQKSHATGSADWNVIRTAVSTLDVPILANGSIGTPADVKDCLAFTKAAGVMSSEAILEYPPLFWPLAGGPTESVSSIALALEYMDLAEQYPTDDQGQGMGFKTVRNHMHRFLHGALQEFTDVRDMIVRSKTIDDLRKAVHFLRDTHGYDRYEPTWYRRFRDKKENTNVETDEKDANDKSKGSQKASSIQQNQDESAKRQKIE